MITGTRIRLRAIERSDIPLFATWLNDPEVTQGLLLYLPMSQAQEENWFENMLKQPPEQHPLGIEVKNPDGWDIIGNCGFHAVDWKNRSAEVGIFIGKKELWSQGYGQDAMRLLLRHGFNNLNLHRIYLHVFDNNPRAVRSYEKVGFIHEGRLRQDIYKNGSFHDVLVMSVLRPEWQDSEI
jgi:diamine N-acetyltransferase